MDRRSSLIIIFLAIVAVSVALYGSSLPASSGNARMKASQMIIDETGLPGSWERARFPGDVMGNGNYFDIAGISFWMNDSSMSQAAFLVIVCGYASPGDANSSYANMIQYAGCTLIGNPNIGKNATAWSTTNEAMSYQNDMIVWDSVYCIYSLKMNYLVGITCYHQNSSGISLQNVEEVALDQVHKIG